MSDSDDSEYNVEDFIIPDTVRHTYNNEDVLSNDEQGSNSSDSETEDNVEPDQEILNPQCKLSNGNGKKTESDDEQSEDEPVRANKRYILYVTNLATETTKTMLEDFFNDAGLVRSIRIPKVRLGCYAFVEMADFDGFKVTLGSHYFSIFRECLIIVERAKVQQQGT